MGGDDRRLGGGRAAGLVQGCVVDRATGEHGLGLRQTARGFGRGADRDARLAHPPIFGSD